MQSGRSVPNAGVVSSRWGAPGHFIPGSVVEGASVLRLPHAAPLLEEEWYACAPALVANAADPLGVHRTRPVAALAAYDDPMNPVEVKLRDGAEQRLDAEKPYARRCSPKVLDAPRVPIVLDAHAQPDVRRWAESWRQSLEPLGSLREHLELVLWALAHDVEYTSDILHRHVLVKEVRHAVHEDEPPAAPALG